MTNVSASKALQAHLLSSKYLSLCHLLGSTLKSLTVVLKRRQDKIVRARMNELL